MGVKQRRFTTTLTLKECAGAFERAGDSAPGGVAVAMGVVGKLAGGDFKRGDFYTPEDASPFAALDDDRPDFSVGVNIRRYGNPPWTPIHMYAWKRTGGTEVVLASEHTLTQGGHSNRLLERFVDVFREHDPAIKLG